MSIEHLTDLCRRLAPVYPTEATRTAAHEFLELGDVGEALGRVVWHLTWQRVLWLVLERLEEAGADLDRVMLSRERVDEVFASRRPLWVIPSMGSVSARHLLRVLVRHKQLLGEPLVAATEMGMDRFVAVAGRAFEAAYPGYTTRFEFDSDLVVTTLDDGSALTRCLHRCGYPFHHARFLRMEPYPEATFQHRREVGDHLVGVEVMVGRYHSYRGDVVARSRPVAWKGVTLRVPSAEDMLVMVAARVVRKRQFDFVNTNDVAVIIHEERTALDWDLVTGLARADGLEAVLSELLRGAEDVVGPGLVPGEVWRRLTRSRSASLLDRLTRAVSDPGERLVARERRTGRSPTAVWRGAVRLRQILAGAEANPLLKIRRRAELRLYSRQLRRLRTGSRPGQVDRLGRRLRPRCGSLCEVDPTLAGGDVCLARLGGRPWDDEAGRRLRTVAAEVPVHDPAHDCDAYRFELLSRR